jgi:pimeloyl-ACP methyl ester carboxylesterase
MSEAPPSGEFTHTVRRQGSAAGMVLTGLSAGFAGPRPGSDVPLVVALHGGTYTSTYFDIPGYSLLGRAAAVGIPIIALDRPGYKGSTPVPESESIILANAEVLDQVIGEIWEDHGRSLSGVVLVAHSIGGAVATALAARRPSWPLLGLATSGCLLKVPGDSREAWQALPKVPTIDLPSPMKDQVMFGPAWTYTEGMPAASHPADAPVPRAELIDITTTWIARVRETAAQVSVPVFHRQGEFDALWVTDRGQVEQFGEAFTAAPSVDAGLQPGTGHCIDFHRQSAAFQLAELAFALRCAAPSKPPAE